MDNNGKSRKKSRKQAVQSEEQLSPEQLADVVEFALLETDDLIVFPSVIFVHTMQGESTPFQLKQRIADDQHVIIAFPQELGHSDPKQLEHYYPVAVLTKVMKVSPLPGGDYHLTMRGRQRVRLLSVHEEEGYMRARALKLQDEELAVMGARVYEDQAIFRKLKKKAMEYLTKFVAPSKKDAKSLVEASTDAAVVTDYLAFQTDMPLEDRLALLSTLSVRERMNRLLALMEQIDAAITVLEETNQRVRSEMDKHQRDYFLRQHIQALKVELGDNNEGDIELQDLEKRASEMLSSEETKDFTLKQLKRLAQMQPSSTEYAMLRVYIESLLDVPWGKFSQDNMDLQHAREILEADHHGLEDVKKRVLEHLAVLSLKKDMRAPIICLAGPPGVGKTSLGQSVARALGREFHRISLGGLHDESELRGHRRTYVSSMPGRIIQGLRRTQVMNPVFLLDEIDKVGHDHRGDPSYALLEILDPEQNKAFHDNYIDQPVDLSKVLFIATANNLDTIPSPLRDRMEIIEISSYTIREKLAIAQKHLLPKLSESHGILLKQFELPEEVILTVISAYTAEAGVRQLEQRLSAIFRRLAFKIAEMRQKKQRLRCLKVKLTELEQYLGKPIYDHELAERELEPGVATGMAWTPVGGTITFFEIISSPGTGQLLLTGKLGEVMQESVRAALTLLKTRAKGLGLEDNFLSQKDLHLHAPAGGTPKDGPSAGVTIFSAMLGLFKGLSIDSKLAMTGEISLRGQVLPVGGIKEKILSAHRAGIKTILLPQRNMRDLSDIPEEVLEQLTVHGLENIDDVIRYVFPTLHQNSLDFGAGSKAFPKEGCSKRGKAPALESKSKATSGVKAKNKLRKEEQEAEEGESGPKA